ncbi:MAG: hypothetical protein CO093_01920 [Alphaproteobacteria bacterium CG_4_9_14_3_um_filter_47_13]|nr:MAG: hypothetical protein CO093_01920 [Alphaproteobacteria bacterium CG_4_9_14_3_um_filter_47_13]
MTQRSLFQVQILEKLGAPLMAAVSEVESRQNAAADDTRRQEAGRVAELLGKAVSLGVALSSSMDMKDAGSHDDSVRLALTALSGQIIAGQYKLAGKVPNENDIKRMVKTLEAVLTFSDNFTPAAENTSRLENMDPSRFSLDENQINIQYMGTLAPVINIVAGFSFGRPEAKLMQEIADKLVLRARQLREKVFTDGTEQTTRQAELLILKALSCLYVECHREEMDRLMAMDVQTRAQAAESSGGLLSMEGVWQSFDTRAGMMEVLGLASMPDRESAGNVSSPAIQNVEPAPIVPDKVFAPLPEPLEKQEDPVDKGAYNPMGFFTPKPQTDDDTKEGS